ncbi:hypothetical protein ACGGZK_14905 [Agromyces sp. MMS24-K17]|uniref:hypothetical protein n=1 Tax=Agromyces sp. MMS24-K17 TaxID=3372850 RepID=UPI003753F412
MQFVDIADVIAWIVLIPALAAAAVLSLIAFLRPRPLLTWLGAGAIVMAVLAAASLSAPVPLLGGIVGVLAFTAAVLGGGPAAHTALALAMGPSVTPGLHGGILVADRVTPGDAVIPPPRREVLRGGLTIGVLERVASAGAIIIGFPEAIAIVVAVKGVGRFTELEAPEARERFIIGTLASLTWAGAAAFAAHLALR